jgi:asparagine synthase (glutamine-hydrolysing)
MIFSMEERLKFFGSEKAEWLLETDPCRQFEKYYQEAADLDESDQHAYVDIQTWLVDDILVKTDRATMHCGLEARCPYLDLKVMEVCTGANPAFRKDKLLLKELAVAYLPKHIIHARKSGFNAPIGKWMNIKENEFKWLTRHIFEQKLK